MKERNICLSAKTVDIAEHENFIEMVNRLCYYDDANLNDVCLPYTGCEEQAKVCASSLVNMPVQAKYIVSRNGDDDLGSHEAYIDEDGNMQFDTQSIGTHTEAWIEEAEVTTVKGETKKLPCLFAKARIWTRYPNIVATVKKLFESEDGLNSSWEIATKKYSYSDGIKTLTDYEFLGNTLLGSTVTPAYKGTSSAISVSQAELMIAEALSQDLSSVEDTKTNKEENELDNENVVVTSDENAEATTPVVEEAEVNVEEVAEENPEVSADEPKDEEEVEDKDDEEKSEVEASALTTHDLHSKLREACRAKVPGWGYIAFVFPEEHYLLYDMDESAELDYIKFNYTVNGDVVEVSDPENVTLSISVSAINETVANYEKSISEKDEVIVNASAEINELKAQITELSQYKEKFEQAEQERIAQELADKKEELISSIVKSGQITREEIAESEELTGYVNNLDKASLMALVGERLISSIEAKPETEISSAEVNTEVASVNLNANDDDNVTLNASKIMRDFIGK